MERDVFDQFLEVRDRLVGVQVLIELLAEDDNVERSAIYRRLVHLIERALQHLAVGIYWEQVGRGE